MLADRIFGGTLTLGGSDNTNGTLIVNDASGNTIGTWNNSGITLNKGSIAGPSIELGGSGNTIGTLTVKDRSGTTIGTWGYDGISASGKFVSKYSSNGISSELSNGRLCFYKNTSLKADVSTYYNYLSIDAFDMPIYIEVITGGYNYVSGVHFTTGGEIYAKGNLSVSGTKSRIVATDQYSDRRLYCYETPSPLFGDVGEAIIGDDGLCYVTIDPIFAQTITTDNYQVFLQKYGDGDCYVMERKPGWVVVAGTPGLTFGWEIKGKQQDYDQLRLERNDEKFTVPTQTYGEDAANHIDEIRKEREAA